MKIGKVEERAQGVRIPISLNVVNVGDFMDTGVKRKDLEVMV